MLTSWSLNDCSPQLLPRTLDGQPNGDEAKVVTANLRGGQAVVHLIDLVLTPPEEEQKPAEPTASPAPSSGSGPCTYTVG